MKEKKISIFTGVIVTALAAIGYVAYGQYQNRQIVYANPLMEENIDALAENTPSCMLIRDSCSFTITNTIANRLFKELYFKYRIKYYC